MTIAEIAASNIQLKCTSLMCKEDATMLVNIDGKIKLCCSHHADLWRTLMLDNALEITMIPAVDITIITAETPKE